MAAIKRLLRNAETGVGSVSSSQSNTNRTVRTVLAPPDFLVNPSVLIDSFIEWPVRLLGQVPDIRPGRDISTRAYLLNLIDTLERGQRPYSPVESFLSLSVANLRLERRQPPNDILLRVGVSQLIAVAYVRDNEKHIVAVHHATAASTAIHVLLMHAKIHAQEVCAVTRQLLQLAYTEATLEFLDQALDFAATAGGSSQSGDSSFTPATSVANSPAAGKRPTDSPQELMQNLVTTLAGSLSKSDLVTFGQVFRSWSAGQLSFTAAKPQLEQLFPIEFNHLLLALRQFIPARDEAAFDEFLQERGVRSLSSQFNRSQSYRRSLSVTSTASSQRSGHESDIDFDLALESIVAQVRNLDLQQQQFSTLPAFARSNTHSQQL